MAAIYESVLDQIGRTPLVELRRIHAGPGRLFAKMEHCQPGGSVKDRAALSIISLARANGSLAEDQPVVEMTSGNMGSGLAIVCAAIGHPFTAVMSEGNSRERAVMIERLGGEVVLTEQVDGIPGRVTGQDIGAAVAEAKRLAREKAAYYVDQFSNEGSWLAHYQGTGPEIWEALSGKVDCFVACVGSGGTFVGTSRYLKERASHVACVAVEPAGAEILAGRDIEKPTHVLQGTGYGLVPPHWDPTLVDAYAAVSDSEAERMAAELGEKEGLFVGFSAAANVVAARRWLAAAESRGASPTVVTVLCDTGLKYVSSWI